MEKQKVRGMNSYSDLNSAIQELYTDQDFAARTTSFVIRKRRKERTVRSGIFGIAAVGVIALSALFLTGRNTDRIQVRDITSLSTEELSTQRQTEARWSDTDDVISSALANR